MSKKYLYSAIILLKETPGSAFISELQHSVAKEYDGESTISLPTHITLARWKSTSSTFIRLKPKTHLRPVNMKLNVKEIEISADHNAIWYKVRHSKRLLQFRDDIYATLIGFSISEADITLDDQFHITLAYKDYSKRMIDKIYEYLHRVTTPAVRSLRTEMVVTCQRRNDAWRIVDPRHQE